MYHWVAIASVVAGQPWDTVMAMEIPRFTILTNECLALWLTIKGVESD
jgi:hypothetical protein